MHRYGKALRALDNLGLVIKIPPSSEPPNWDHRLEYNASAVRGHGRRYHGMGCSSSSTAQRRIPRTAVLGATTLYSVRRIVLEVGALLFYHQVRIAVRSSAHSD